MSWHETHERSQVLHEVEAVLATDPHAELPWSDEHARLFGDRAGLAEFLRYRWHLRLAEPAVDDAHRLHPARVVALVCLAALDLQDGRRAAA